MIVFKNVSVKNSFKRVSVIWSLACVFIGTVILNDLLKNEATVDIISILMPLYFIVWFLSVYMGHALIRKMYKPIFYKSSLHSQEIELELLNESLEPAPLSLMVKWSKRSLGDKKIPRKATIDVYTGVSGVYSLHEYPMPEAA